MASTLSRSFRAVPARPVRVAITRHSTLHQSLARSTTWRQVQPLHSSSRALSATTITQHLPQKHRYVRRGWQPNPARCAPIAPISPSSGLPLTNLPYFVRRTAGNQLPVYTDTKAGGTLQQTKIQKIEGSLEALRDQLAQELGINAKDGITINHLTGHVIVKGWKRPQITKFLLERGF